MLVTLIVGLSSCTPAKQASSGKTTSYFIKLKPAHPAYEYRQLIKRVAGWAAERDPVGSELIIIKHGKPIFRGNWGELDRERQVVWSKNTICRLRSLSNPILTTALLLLQQQGKLALNDPIAKYLPEFDVARWGALTIAQLCGLTATLPTTTNKDLLARSSDLCGFVERLSKETPHQRQPKQQYSESNYNVLACLITQVSGMPVEGFLEKRIFKPLGMKDSHSNFQVSATWIDRIASTYSVSGGGLGYRRIIDGSAEPAISYFHSSRGIYSTVEDYALFMRFWMRAAPADEQSLLSDKLIKLGHQIPRGVPFREGAHTNVWKVYGAQPLDDKIPAPFGYFGADESVALASPEKGLIFVYFTQSRGGDSARAFANYVTDLFR